MKLILIMSAVLSLWLVSGQQSVSAQQLSLWYTKSQIICVATAGASKPSPVVYNGTVPVLPIYTQFTLKRLFGKQALEQSFAVATYDYTWYYPPLPGKTSQESPVPFRTGETYLLFLTRAPQFGQARPGLPLRLAFGAAPSAFHPSFLSVGTELPPPYPTDTPLRAILRILLTALSDKSQSVQADAVFGLGGYGPFLWDYIAYPNLAYSPSGKWQSIQDRGDIAAELEQTVLPALRKRLAANTDEEDRIQLTTALGLLQEINVIPELAATAKQKHEKSSLDALASYEVPTALPALSKEFLSDDPAIAKACINSVISSRDTKAVPMLVDALLHSPNADVRYTAYYALHGVTALSGNYGPADFPAHEQEVDRFWQDWLKNHWQTSTEVTRSGTSSL